MVCHSASSQEPKFQYQRPMSVKKVSIDSCGTIHPK